jgi:hypothetical protein
MKRKAALFLALLLVSQTLLSCAETEDETPESEDTASVVDSETAAAENTETADGETRAMHNLPADLKFDGAVFNVLYPEWQGYKYYFFATELNGDVMNDAIYARKTNVEETLDVEITETDSGGLDYIKPAVEAMVQAGDDTYQLALTHCITGVATMSTGGMLYNFDDFKYTDLDAEWWNHDMMNALRLGKNTYYGISDYMIPCPYVIYFNKDIISQYGFDDPYELVYNKQWTVDKFIELAESATQDTDGDGKYTKDDMRGICYEETSKWTSFMIGAGQKMIEKNDSGEWEICMDTEKMYTLVEKFCALSLKDGVIAPENSISVADGNLLFELHTLAHAVNYRESECSIGILPYPLFDENQENYISLDWGGLMCCPITIKNPDMVGAVLELLAYESGNEVIPAYYEKVLEGKIARDEDTIAMLDIIFDTIAYEPGGNYFGFDGGFSKLFYTISDLAVNGKSTDYASWLKKNQKIAQKVMEKFFVSLAEAEG